MKEARAKRLTNLWSYGDSWLYMFALMAVGAVVGGLLGWVLVREPGPGSAVGVTLGLITWLAMVIAAHKQLGPYRGQHREPEHTVSDRDS